MPRAHRAGRVGGQMALLGLLLLIPCVARPDEISFRNDVQPRLTKLGCNAEACHGALAGLNGFRLSLRGYDDGFDYISLTRHTLGRRFTPHDPGRSLFLLEPTGTVPHKGGVRLA